MQLIAEFRNYDGTLGITDEEDTQVAVIHGNRLTITNGDGKVVARAEMVLDHNKPIWRVSKGARGQEIGIATDITFYV